VINGRVNFKYGQPEVIIRESTDFTNAVNSIEKLVKQNQIEFKSYEDLLRFVASRKFLQSQRNDSKFIDDVARSVLRRLHQPQSSVPVQEYVNKKILTPGWKDTRTILDGKYRLEAEVREWANKPTLFVYVYNDQATDWNGEPKSEEAGYARFVPRGLIFKDLVAGMVYVHRRYRQQGIAQAMYKYAHQLGNSIKPSTAQLPGGKELWQSIKAKGGIENLTEINDDDELSVSERIQDYFTDRGYGYLGEGRDQIAFLSPRGTVVKVLGIGDDEREDIVKSYVGFFSRNQRNPHYPRIYNAGDFTVDGETYFVYEMEYLHPVSGEDRVLEYIEDLMDALPRGEQALAAFYKNKPRPPGLSEQEVDGLVMATQDLEDFLGGQAPLDLRSIENLGRRKDGQIVIIDPFSL
jgi:GNAT superfamily N-acetyltransferase